MWNFWSWKTFHTFLECFNADEKTYVIANVPYSRVDHFYSSVDDLLNVFEVLDDYTMTTNLNVKDYSKFESQTKNILLIVDEAHLYLGARESLTKASILNKLKLIFTQCRKRKIRIVFITQRLTQIDIYVRRLADYVEEYHRSSFLGLYRVKKSVYENRWDVADIETDQTIKYTNEWEMKAYKEDAKLYSELSFPLTMWLQLFSFFSPWYRKIIKEYYQTYYVCWQDDARVVPLTKEKLIEWLLIEKHEKLSLKKIFQIYTPTFYKAYEKCVLFDKKARMVIEKIMKTGVSEDNPKILENFNLQALERARSHAPIFEEIANEIEIEENAVVHETKKELNSLQEKLNARNFTKL